MRIKFPDGWDDRAIDVYGPADRSIYLYECVDNGIEWKNTDEGHEFWRDVVVNLARLAGFNDTMVMEIRRSYHDS